MLPATYMTLAGLLPHSLGLAFPMSAGQVTMTSREIADLVESRHDNVKVTLERLADRGVIQLPAVQEVKNHLGQTVTEYLIGKRDSFITVAQLSPEFTARLVDRWQELEAGKVPRTIAQALRLAADQAERLEAQQLQIEAAKPAVDFVEHYVQAEGLQGFREVCKLLKANRARFCEFVLSERVMYRSGRTLTAYQNHIDTGRFEVRTGVTKTEYVFSSTKFTPKGVEWIAGKWAKYQLRHGEPAS